MRKHKILWYYILTLACTIITGGLVQTLLAKLLPPAAAMAIMQMSPLCGLSLLCLFCRNWQPFKEMQWNPFKYKKNILYIFVSILIPAAVITGAAVFSSILGKRFIPGGYNSVTAVIIVIATIIGCIGEEAGWRGFLLPEFCRKRSLLMSGVFTGIMWGAWHFGKLTLYGIAGYLLFIFMITELSVIMSWIYSKTGGNLTSMVIFHTSVNMTSVIALTGREGIIAYVGGCIVGTVICAAILTVSRNEFLKRPEKSA